VSVTPDGREKAEDFVETFGVEWPCFYNTPHESLEALGAIAPDSGWVAPTVYVLGRDGSVVWNDRAARFTHQNPDDSIRELRRAIDKALSSGG
jgi:hypothetical protein